MPKEFIDNIIEESLARAEAEGITGKAVTPYLLRRIWTATKGETLATNVGFVKNNALIGSQIAVHLSALEVN
jgi:pseudouridylate synthase